MSGPLKQGTPRLGILAGAFNPVTRAHLALIEAGLAALDDVICVVPRVYPHKEFHGASLDDRVEMLRSVRGSNSVVVCESGLFLDIARELRVGDPESEFYFICGRDAAERVIEWDYGQPDTASRMLDEFRLLVAARHGEFMPPAAFRHRVEMLALPEDFSNVSSTEVRHRIAAGHPWEHLVPKSIVEIVRRLYAAG